MGRNPLPQELKAGKNDARAARRKADPGTRGRPAAPAEDSATADETWLSAEDDYRRKRQRLEERKAKLEEELEKLERKFAETLLRLGPVRQADDDPVCEKEVLPEPREKEETQKDATEPTPECLQERRRLDILLGQGLSAELITSGATVSSPDLEAFCNSMAVRILSWRRYSGKAKPANLAAVEAEHPCGPYRHNLKLGMPFRVLNKASVYLTKVCLEHLETRGEMATEDVLFNVCLFRSWTNDAALFKKQLSAYRALGGKAGGQLFSAEHFDNSLWLEAVLLVRKDIGRSRSGAYNPGSFGAAKGQSSLEAFVRRLPAMQAALAPLVGMLDNATGLDAGGWKGHSAGLLAFLQGGFGLGAGLNWLAYQVCLDLGALRPAWFDAASICMQSL